MEILRKVVYGFFWRWSAKVYAILLTYKFLRKFFLTYTKYNPPFHAYFYEKPGTPAPNRHAYPLMASLRVENEAK